MKTRFISIVLMITLVTALFTACGSSVEYYNIATQNNVYSMGTQSVVIKSSSPNSDEPTARFKESISSSDIELGKTLEGKTVTKVTYNSATSITVELSGNTKMSGGDGVLGSITVKHSGLESEGDSSCVVEILAPELRVSSYMSNVRKKGEETVYKVIATLSLPVGEFSGSATAENITLTNGATGELSVKLSDGALTVTVENCNMANPSICIGSDVTTFGKEITVRLAAGGGAAFQ